MLKGLVILALAFFVFPVQAYVLPHKAQKASENTEPSPSTPPVAPKQNSGPSIQPEADKHVNADVWLIHTPGKDGYEIATFWVSVAIAMVTIFGVAAAWKG